MIIIMVSKKVIDYYKQCHSDYKNLWRIDKNYSLHYGFYDSKHTTHGETVVNMNRVLAKIAKIKPEDKILDAGCGIGGSAIWLAKHFGARVTGINISRMQLKIAKNLAKENKVDNLVQFDIRDFNNTKFPKNSFDVVWGLESICHAENKKKFLREAIRVLKAGGRIIIADGFLKNKELAENEGKIYNRWRDGWAVPNLSTVGEFHKYLKELKFQKIKFKDITKNVMPSSIRLYRASIIAYPIGKLLEWLGFRTKVQTKNIVSAYYQHKIVKRKIGVHGIFYAEK